MKRRLVILYLMGVVITFGHVWNLEYSDYREPQMARLDVSFAASAFWPLYWSTVLWDR